MVLTPKQRREIHNSRKTMFFKLKKDAVSAGEKMKDTHHINLFKVLAGENKGRWCLHMIEIKCQP